MNSAVSKPMSSAPSELLALKEDRGWRSLANGGQAMSMVPALIALSAILLYFGVTEEFFFTPRNIYNLLVQSAVVATLALGMTLVLLLGEIDLSVAALAGVCAAVMGLLMEQFAYSPWVAIGAALATGLVFGVAQGAVIALVGAPSFIVTLATLLGFQGLMLYLLGSLGSINISDPSVRALMTSNLPSALSYTLVGLLMLSNGTLALRQRARRSVAGLPHEPVSLVLAKSMLLAAALFAGVWLLDSYRGVPLIIVLLMVLTTLMALVARHTPFGRSVYAVGGDAESSRRVGMNVQVIRIAVFGAAGLVAAFAGILGASRYGAVSFSSFAGGSLLLDVIGAAVIGGTSLFGGRGSIWNALLGALVIGSLGNGLDLFGASSAVKLMLSGAILLIAVTLDAWSRRRLQAQ